MTALAAPAASPEACAFRFENGVACGAIESLHGDGLGRIAGHGYQPATASAAARSEEGDGRYTSTVHHRTYSERTGR